MHVQYVILLRWEGLRSYARRTGTIWPLSDSKTAEFNRFAATYQANTTMGTELRQKKGFRHFRFIIGSEGQTVMKTLPHCDLQCFHVAPNHPDDFAKSSIQQHKPLVEIESD